MRCGVVWFVRFSYYKTANRTAPCCVVRCSAVMSFCGRFWCSFCGLVNTPNQTYSLVQRTVYVVMYLFAILLEKVRCNFYILLEINN